uniref:Peptidoglycan recognition protein 14 n=1 Tax=Nephotettix cincticeps TaxID=94400 RepID=A0A5H2X8R3_NEPCI|nr:peptidoglycan recognition protein 14 [Nephotettix cincticeps]
MGKDKYNPFRTAPIRRVKLPPYIPPQVVPRAEWGAVSALETLAMEPTALPVDNVILTYFTNTANCEDSDSCHRKLREIQVAHMSRGLPDIAYNLLIGGDLKIYEGRGWDWKPEKHDLFPDIHDDSIEIAFIGDYRDVQAEIMGNLIKECLSIIDLGVQVKNVREFFHIKESTPKLRLDTLGNDERGGTRIKRTELEECPDIYPVKPPTRHPYYS